jgi:hypothetical protein
MMAPAADWFPWLTEGLLLLVVGLIGLVGNTCSIAIFARQRIQRVFHHLLLMLAAFDAVSSQLLRVVINVRHKLAISTSGRFYLPNFYIIYLTFSIGLYCTVFSSEGGPGPRAVIVAQVHQSQFRVNEVPLRRCSI